jgi:sugar O-acyltransferase (sialic acid O-acetyltransferase NeuD family)
MMKLVIAGGGGFGAEAAWVAEEMNAGGFSSALWNILGYIDDNPDKTGGEFYGYKVLGLPEEVGHRLGKEEIWYFCAIGDNRARERMAGRLSALGWRAATLIHPSVIQARNVSIGEGTYVGSLSILSPNCSIGKHVIVNQRVSIGHDAIINDFCNICPGAQINGFCSVGQKSLIGSNASIHQNRCVGNNATVGANSSVIQDVSPNTSVIGVPARNFFMRQNIQLALESASHPAVRKTA